VSERGDKLSDYLYHLPAERIAQRGIEPRDHSKLLVLQRTSGAVKHRHFYDLPEHLRPGDLLVFNETRVIPARLRARKESGARVEVLLVRRQGPAFWWAMVKPGRRLKEGARLLLGNLRATVIRINDEGLRLLEFSEPLQPHLHTLGETPLPPYIHEPVEERRYQTVYARRDGSVAAPTAGLHFTEELLEKIAAMGVETARLVLHVGPGTFQPVKGSIEQHRMHAEVYHVPWQTAAAVNRALQEGRRVVAVGTTVVRTLESAYSPKLGLKEGAGETRLFIRPPFRFAVVGALITNFHLPGSTLLMLVAAFAGYRQTMAAYEEALAHDYRFFSLGDAMLIE